MADEETPAGEPQESTTETPAPAGEPPAGKTPIPPEVAKQLRQANKEAETLRLKLREYEEKGMSEQEKLARQIQDTEARAIQAEARLMQFEVAQAKGLTAAQAKYLSGSTREELEARADEILTDFPASPSNGFVPMFDNGARGTGTNATSDMNSLIRRAAGLS